MFSKGETLRKGGRGIAPNWLCWDTKNPIARNRGYRWDSLAVSRNTGPLSPFSVGDKNTVFQKHRFHGPDSLTIVLDILESHATMHWRNAFGRILGSIQKNLWIGQLFHHRTSSNKIFGVATPADACGEKILYYIILYYIIYYIYIFFFCFAHFAWRKTFRKSANLIHLWGRSGRGHCRKCSANFREISTLSWCNKTHFFLRNFSEYSAEFPQTFRKLSATTPSLTTPY